MIERGWVRVSFADAVRELALECDPITPHGEFAFNLARLVESEGWAQAKKSPAVRQFLQNLGTGARKVLGANVWVEVAERKIHAAKDAAGVVLTDVRFPNEVAMIRAYGGTLIRITRPGVGPVNGHVSETAIDEIAVDDTILNDGTPEQLHRRMDALGLLGEALAGTQG